MAYTTEDIRNIAFVGHTAAGKTTLIEAPLASAGRIPQPGEVSRGNTVCDFDPWNPGKGHSLDTALVSLDWQGCHINLIDTRGTGHPGQGSGSTAGCRDRGRGGERPGRHRGGYRPDDAACRRARAVPADHRQPHQGCRRMPICRRC